MKLFENIKSGIEKISVDSLKDKVEAIKDTVPKKNRKKKKRRKLLLLKRKKYQKVALSVHLVATLWKKEH